MARGSARRHLRQMLPRADKRHSYLRVLVRKQGSAAAKRRERTDLAARRIEENSGQYQTADAWQFPATVCCVVPPAC